MNSFCDSCGAGLSKRQFNCPHCGYRVVEPSKLGTHEPPSQRRGWTPHEVCLTCGCDLDADGRCPGCELGDVGSLMD